MTTQEDALVHDTVPIIIDLGKKKRRTLKSLRRGRGRLMDEVEQTVQEVRAGLSPEDAVGKELVPIVIIYKKKRKRSKGGFGRLF